jgi:hypothetical protein
VLTVIIFRTQRRLVIEGLIIILVLIIVPTTTSFFVSKSPLSTVAGLYITYPAVMVASAKFGLVGASGASFIVGISSTVSTLIWIRAGNPLPLHLALKNFKCPRKISFL